MLKVRSSKYETSGKAKVSHSNRRKLRLRFSSSLLSKNRARKRNVICDVPNRNSESSNASSRK